MNIRKAIDLLLTPYGLDLDALHREALKPGQRFLSIKDAMRYTNLSRGTLWRLRESGKIPVILCGGRVFFDVLDLERFMLRHKCGAEQ